MRRIVENHDYSSTQINLPPEIGEVIINWGRENIQDKDVYNEGEDYGREDEPHVTVLYGITNPDPSPDLIHTIQTTLPFDIEFGTISIFEQDDYDVVKIEATGMDLYELNQKISHIVQYHNEHEYHPHVTIAYVKKGRCKKLVGMSPFVPEVFEAREVKFSGSGGHVQMIKFGGLGSSSPVEKAEESRSRRIIHSICDHASK